MKIWRAYDKPTPCDTCQPKALEINQPYLLLYQFVSDQYIMGPGGAIGLNFLAVDRAMDYFEVDPDERVEFYDKVRTIAAIVLTEQYKQRDAEMKAQSRKK